MGHVVTTSRFLALDMITITHLLSASPHTLVYIIMVPYVQLHIQFQQVCHYLMQLLK